MTEKEKAKAYDEAIEKAKKWHNISNPIYCNIITEKIFPELKESEDEEIRKEIISILRNAYWTSNRNRFNKLVAWLEKQGDKDKLIQELGEYKVKYTQEVLEKYINNMSNKDDERLRKTAIAFLKDFAEQGYENAVECIDWLEKQGKPKPYSGVSFKHNGHIWDMCARDNGVEILVDGEIKERIFLDNKPQGKLALEALKEEKVDNANKVEPEFKVGDWVVNKFGDSWHIDSFDKKNYQVSDGKGNYNYFPISKQDEMHLWTIKDGRDGDVLCCKSGWMCIFKSLNNHTNTFSSYCFMDRYKWFSNSGSESHTLDKEFINAYNAEIHPATKEQRDLLFQKMKEAGYEWDAKKKELKKLVPNKFDPKTLKPFDKVLVRDSCEHKWRCALYSHTIEGENSSYRYITENSAYEYCIPYNDDTKYLLGTRREAPEYYKYWEK